MKGHTKVSVVVPVFNPGANIDGLINSLDKQTLPPGEFEVVFVDDGSTDDTRARLLDVARTRPHVIVTTIANSGWPGRPRNVGTDLAHGEYVFYSDHDDEFFPEALERMYAMAKANRSDVLYGKLVRVGRPTPYWSLARSNISKADAPVALGSLTVHKLFRREFLLEHQIRFPEGRVRLEDHNFMAQVLPHAKVVSVLADYPCYRWIHRTDGSNAPDAEVDQRSYWGYYAGVLRTMEASAGPGPLLDATRVTAMVAAFTRIPTRDFLRWDLPDRARTFDALQGFVNEQFPPWFDEQIPVLKRLPVQALRSGEMSRFEQLLRWRTNMEFTFALASVRWVDGRMLIGVDASLVDEEGDLLAMDQVGDSLVLPAGLGPPRGAGAALCVLTTTEQGAGEITIRHRESGVEWPVESVEHPNAAPADEQHNLKMHLEGRVDPARGFFGRELETGIWDVLVRVQFLGERQVRRIPVDAKTPVPSRPQHVGGREVRVYRTKAGTLAMKISTGATPPIGVLKAHWEADHLVIHLDVPETGTSTGTQLVFRQRSAGNEQRVAVQDGTARFVLGHSDRGDIFDFYLRTSVRDGGFQDQRLAFGSAQVSQRQPYRIYATVHGSFSVKHLGPSSTPPRTRAQRVHGWLSRRGRFPTR